MWYPAQMAPGQSLMLVELLVSDGGAEEAQGRPKYPLRECPCTVSFLMHGAHHYSPPCSQKSLLGQWQLCDNISICPRIIAVAVGSSKFRT